MIAALVIGLIGVVTYGAVAWWCGRLHEQWVQDQRRCRGENDE